MNISSPLSAPGYYPLPAASRDTRPAQPASDEAAAADALRRHQAQAPHERVMQGELLHRGRGHHSRSGVFDRARILDGYSQPASDQHLARRALDQYLENSQQPQAGAGPTIDYYA